MSEVKPPAGHSSQATIAAAEDIAPTSTVCPPTASTPWHDDALQAALTRRGSRVTLSPVVPTPGLPLAAVGSAGPKELAERAIAVAQAGATRREVTAAMTAAGLQAHAAWFNAIGGLAHHTRTCGARLDALRATGDFAEFERLAHELARTADEAGIEPSMMAVHTYSLRLAWRERLAAAVELARGTNAQALPIMTAAIARNDAALGRAQALIEAALRHRGR